jgi:hypothetical protein
MNFDQALVELQAGKYVKRAGWADGYCCLMPDMAYVWRILTIPNANAGNYLPTLSDLLADDWGVYCGSVASTPVPEGAETAVPPAA